VRYPGEAVTRHPWPLYECAGLLLLAALFWNPERFAGRRAPLYLACYALLRLPLEALRGDRVRGLMLHGWVSVSQLLSIVVLIGALAWLRHDGGSLAHA
jgi:prolipoprotein diacylglyceryltransferase